MKFRFNLVFILLVIVLISAVLFRDVSAAEDRDGLLISVGGGIANSEITFESRNGEKDNYTSSGFAFSARLGWCFNEHFLLYWDMRESAYFKFKPAGNDTYHAGLWTSIGSSYYINKSPDSFYLTGALGLGDLETGKLNSDAIVGTGFSFLIGPGYIINNKVGVELDWMRTDIGKNDRIENDFTANSYRLIIYWQFL